MLAADKLQLQSALKQQATALKEKEFNLHHSNLMTVGTQAAVLAGLDITMFIEFNPPDNEAWLYPNSPKWMYWIPRLIKLGYFITIVGAFCANMIVVSHTTALSVLGAGLALRGPDGSMVTATDGLYEERRSVFYVFGVGLALTVGSVLFCVWLLLHWEAAIVCMSATLYTSYTIYRNYRRVVRKFTYNENDTVDFTDIFEGPASIRVVPKAIRRTFERISGTSTKGRRSTDEDAGQEQYDDDDYKGTSVRENNDMYDETQSLTMVNNRMRPRRQQQQQQQQQHAAPQIV